MKNYERALKTLEYDKILAMLAERAPTDGARELALALRPVNDPDRIVRLQRETTEAKGMQNIKGMPSFGRVKDILPIVERTEKGAVLSQRELLDLANVLRTARSLLEYSRMNRREKVALDEKFERLIPDKKLEDRILTAIVAEDMIADEASPALSDIRRKIKNINNRIKDTLQSFIGGAYSKYLQENIITQRAGRYVIPVKVECKNDVRGLVHDTSASGATLFIEPLPIVEANNELRVQQVKEQNEIERILAELSAACGAIANTLELNYKNITELAFIFAKSDLSVKLDGVAARITGDRSFKLVRARHPLLDPKTVVPVTVTLGGDMSTLVITGPNTGGKTVTIKTLGLFALMAQSGLHIPASDMSELCIFDDIYADIGDEQSIEQSLSTFSSHMVNIVGITERVNERSLVLIDELGAGTDPVEGAALAIAVLEKVHAVGALCAATTHYAELKAFALETPGFVNASCEFDVNTLKPTYRLIIGTPGKSNAFAISSKLGLSDEIVSRAKELVSEDNKRFEDVIEKLEASRLEMDKNRAEAERLRREFEEYKATSERRIADSLAKAEQELEKARAQAVSIVESAKISSAYIMEQLEKVKKERDSANLSNALEEGRRNIRRQLKESDAKINPVNERVAEDYVLPRPLKKGDDVLLINVNQKGVLLDDPDKDGNVMVQAGIIKTRTKVANLMLLNESRVTFTDSQKKQMAADKYRVTVSRDFKDEIDLRGLNGEEAWFKVDKYFDEAKIAGIHTVRLIHGKGTGALRAALWTYLKGDPRVKSHRYGKYGEGDLGVTVVEVK
ncbi:MAG: endonuclease MutS2 [Ruminococcaceae bacterium]|nr:endonuclease MutS2 [Oscillospiraceae bacterium]